MRPNRGARGGVVTNGCAVLVLGSLGISMLLGFWYAANPSQHAQSTPSAAPAPAPPNDPEATKRFEACRAKLKKAASLEMLHDLSWKSGALPPRVVVGRTFFTVPFDAKEGFAETVNCFLMGGKPKFINFDLLDWRDEKVVATYSYGHLKME